MNNLEATFTEISNWQKNVHYSTGGTRSKYIALNPDNNEEYFFKGSKETLDGEIRYPTEFWSEIVSSKIGQYLGFEMLDYNIAYDKNHKQKIGCLSKSMILHSENKLTEGIAYLTGYDAKYIPEKHKKKYTFQFINKALVEFGLGQYVEKIIEIIVFDCIVGNSDRHQENWGIISYYKDIYDKVDEHLDKNNKKISDKFSNFFTKLYVLLLKIKVEEKHTFKKADLITELKFIPHMFAPIYDSGCCLGREHEDIKIEKLITDVKMLEIYINKGESEIHWEGLGKKSKHFELLKLLIENYPNQTKPYIDKIIERFNGNKILEIVQNIDVNLPSELFNYKLSENRKVLMSKLITLRIEKILSLI